MKGKEDVSRESVMGYLKNLQPDQQAKWGHMTPQHMVEHLEIVVNASSNKTPFEVVTPADKIDRYKEKGLMNDYNWPVNTRAPFLKEGQLLPLKYKTLQEAKEALDEAMENYEDYFGRNPEARPSNSVFGPLNHQEWQQFHYKHFRHHFQQFGLMDRPHEEGMR